MSSDENPSTPVEELYVTATIGRLNQLEICLTTVNPYFYLPVIGWYGSLMALRKVCMCADLTARHFVWTKDTGELGTATLHVQQLFSRGVDIGMMYEAACHNLEKTETTDFIQTVTARRNHSCDLLVGNAANRNNPKDSIFTMEASNLGHAQFFPLKKHLCLGTYLSTDWERFCSMRFAMCCDVLQCVAM